MGLLEKLKLVETDAPPETTATNVPISEPPTATVSVQESVSDESTFIEDVYAAIPCEEGKDIFLLRDYIKELPNEMPDQTKVSVTRTFLNVAQFDDLGMLENAKLRRQTLASSLDEFKAKQEGVVSEHEANIAQMKEMIVSAQTEIAQIKKRTEDIEHCVKDEIESLIQYEEFAAAVVKAGEQK